MIIIIISSGGGRGPDLAAPFPNIACSVTFESCIILKQLAGTNYSFLSRECVGKEVLRLCSEDRRNQRLFGWRMLSNKRTSCRWHLPNDTPSVGATPLSFLLQTILGFLWEGWIVEEPYVSRAEPQGFSNCVLTQNFINRGVMLLAI
jgi:hypothetical protein